MSRASAGMAMAVSFNQYWKAWTKVMPFMPPLEITPVTTTPSTTTPTQYGPPRATWRVSPAPFSWGSR
jgi:hypothetical protein